MLYQTPPAGLKYCPVKYGPYSPSRLIVARCPQRFFGQYIRKDRAIGASLNAARGTAIHHVLSKITHALKDKMPLTPAIVANWVSEAVGLWPASYAQIDLIKGAANAYISNPSPYMNKETNCEMALAVAFYEEDEGTDGAVPKRGYVAVPYADDNGLPNTNAFFGGRLDQVTVDHVIKTVTIVDHKSTPNASKNEDVEFQMGCYAWLAGIFWPGYQIKTVIHFCHPQLNFYQAPTYWSNLELQKIEGYIHASIGAVENFQEFPALPGSSCDYCHMVQECPTNLALMEQKARGTIDLNVRSPEDLVRLAEHLEAITALKEEVNAALKNGLENFAPEKRIFINGKWYGFKTSEEAVDWVATDLKIREESARARQLLTDAMEDGPEKQKLELMAKIPDLAALFTHYGIEPGTFKEWQSKKLNSIWKLGKTTMLDHLKEYIVKDRSTRYGAYKN
jgi:PD-(D/E)XK nuclease superfamily